MAKRNLPNMEAVEPETPETVEPAVEEPVKEDKTGVVSGCAKLNVRQKPSLKEKVVCVINKGDKVTIEKKGSNKEWLKVKLASGVEGFCMKKFIQIDS